MIFARAHAGWMASLLVACGTREIPIQSQEAVTLSTAAAPATASAARPSDDDGAEAARANVAKGDAEFEAAARDPSRIANAKSYFEAALIPAGNPVFGYAAYKLAFVYWNRSDFDRSLDMFKKAIDFGAAHPEVEGATTIHDAALHDVVPIYAVVGQPAKAFNFFRVLSGDDAHALHMLEALGREYDATGKLADAKAVQTELKRRDPSRP